MARWVGKLATKEDLHRVETHLNAKIKKMNDKIDRGSEELCDRLDRFSKELCDKIDAGNKDLCDRLDRFSKELSDRLDRSLYILLGGMTVLLGIMAAVQKLLP